MDLNFVTGILFGGMGTALLGKLLAPSTARRIRRDEEREAGLGDLVTSCAQLEGHIDFMLSPERVSSEGVFQTGTVIAASDRVRDLLWCWRTSALRFMPRWVEAGAILNAWIEVEKALGSTNPPHPEFFTRLRDLRTVTGEVRSVAQKQLTKRRLWHWLRIGREARLLNVRAGARAVAPAVPGRFGQPEKPTQGVAAHLEAPSDLRQEEPPGGAGELRAVVY